MDFFANFRPNCDAKTYRYCIICLKNNFIYYIRWRDSGRGSVLYYFDSTGNGGCNFITKNP
jgi:hypothetical protein